MELLNSKNAPDAYLTTREVSERYPVAESTLRYYRHAGIGPKSFKLGRKVVYKETDMRAWMADQEAATSRGGRSVE